MGWLSFAFSGFVALSLSCAHAGGTEDKHEDNDAGGYGKFEFALIGDTPYRDVAQFENVLGYGDACEGEAGSEKDACKRQPPQQDEKK